MSKGARGWGLHQEAHARELAGDLGIPDFVYLPATVQKGNAWREVSDGLLISGDAGVILQVKARDPDAAARDSPAKAAAWVEKKAAEALRQAVGTRREIERLGSITVTSLRGYERAVQSAHDWPAVVIVDHPALPTGIRLDHERTCFWTTLDDWHALHTQLRSTTHVIEYVKRALQSGLNPELGNESSRYDRLALADVTAPGSRTSVPMLPPCLLSASQLRWASIIDGLIEEVWTDDGIVPWQHPDEYRRIVECLDRIPPLIRVRFGRKLWSTFEDSRLSGQRRSFFAIDTSQAVRFAFTYDSIVTWREPETFVNHVAGLAAVRQSHALEVGADPTSATLAVGRLDSGNGLSSYAFAYVDGDPDVPPAVRWAIESNFGVLSTHGISKLPTPGRNDPCPCESGTKFKHCCGA